MKKIKKIIFTFLVLGLVSCVSVDLNLKDFTKDKQASINSALVFGVRPNNPVLYRLAVSGEQPLQVKFDNLPEGLEYDARTGMIEGVLAEEGDYVFTVYAKNQYGEDSAEITFRCGERIALTPPMGWNSWYCYSESVSADNIKTMADAMKNSGLADFGWTYINIDDCWQGVRGGELNAIQGNVRFPDMTELVDYIHSLGLKAGIYSSPWIGTYAGFMGGSSDFEDGAIANEALPLERRPQETQFFGRWPGLAIHGVDRPGKYWLCDRDAKQWADWGFDYVKFDWKPNDVPTTKRIYEDLRKSGRDIVLSLSNAAPIENAEGLAEYSNLWRTTGDIRDSWFSISSIANSHLKWQKYQAPGSWNDPDMLQVGNIGVPNTYVTSFKPTGLTKEEQVTQVSYWAMFSAPLLLSCDLESLDDFTLALLTNKNVIGINQDALGNQAPVIIEKVGYRVVKKEMANNKVAIGIFNKSNFPMVKSFSLEKLGLDKDYKCTNAWTDENVDFTDNKIDVKLGTHSAAIYIFD